MAAAAAMRRRGGGGVPDTDRGWGEGGQGPPAWAQWVVTAGPPPPSPYLSSLSAPLPRSFPSLPPSRLGAVGGHDEAAAAGARRGAPRRQAVGPAGVEVVGDHHPAAAAAAGVEGLEGLQGLAAARRPAAAGGAQGRFGSGALGGRSEEFVRVGIRGT